MFTPAKAIAELDRALGLTGEDVVAVRGNAEQGMRAFVRGFRADELVGLLQQGDREVTVSPTSFGAFGAPRAQDKFVIGTDLVTAQSAEFVRMAGVVVRANLVVRG